MRRAGVACAVGVLVLVIAACNPLVTDPVSMGDLDSTAARYEGPDATWVDLSVTGAPDHTVFAFAAVTNADRTGPTDRCTHAEPTGGAG